MLDPHEVAQLRLPSCSFSLECFLGTQRKEGRQGGARILEPGLQMLPVVALEKGVRVFFRWELSKEEDQE